MNFKFENSPVTPGASQPHVHPLTSRHRRLRSKPDLQANLPEKTAVRVPSTPKAFFMAKDLYEDEAVLERECILLESELE